MSAICQPYVNKIYPLLASYITNLALLVEVLLLTSYLLVTNYVAGSIVYYLHCNPVQIKKD